MSETLFGPPQLDGNHLIGATFFPAYGAGSSVTGESKAHERWVGNFRPSSSADHLLEWLLAYFNGNRPDVSTLQSAILEYKRQANLGAVDLMELRDFAEFVSTADSQLYGSSVSRAGRLVRPIEELIDREGVLL